MPHVALERRLRRLERELDARSDGSGCAPHSLEWLRFWLRWASERLAGKEPNPACISLEAYRALVAVAQAQSNRDSGVADHD